MHQLVPVVRLIQLVPAHLSFPALPLVPDGPAVHRCHSALLVPGVQNVLLFHHDHCVHSVYLGQGVLAAHLFQADQAGIHRTEAVAGHVSATPVPRQKAEMQFRAKMSFMLRAVILKAIAAVWYPKQQTFMHNLQVYTSSQSLVRA